MPLVKPAPGAAVSGRFDPASPAFRDELAGLVARVDALLAAGTIAGWVALKRMDGAVLLVDVFPAGPGAPAPPPDLAPDHAFAAAGVPEGGDDFSWG